MKKQAQLIYTHFGYEKQRLKAKEERLELEMSLNKLALYDVREEQGICQDVLRDELINAAMVKCFVCGNDTNEIALMHHLS